MEIILAVVAFVFVLGYIYKSVECNRLKKKLDKQVIISDVAPKADTTRAYAMQLSNELEGYIWKDGDRIYLKVSK